MSNIRAPAHYPRRILLAVAGLTPQVVTETLYALVVNEAEPFIPTEVHLITTQEGAERARLTLLGEDPGWFHRLCREYGLNGVHLDEDNVHVLRNVQGRPLQDIRTPSDNESAADLISEWIRCFTLDADSALHVSMAGGRKTMGFYAGYALSLYGRPQDRLSHVLVSPAELESHPLFFYPSRSPRVIYGNDAGQRPIDCRSAEVTLGYLPFVQLRHGLPRKLREGKAGFTEAVQAVSRSLGTPFLVVDRACHCLRTRDREVELPKGQFVFYYWLAKRLAEGRELPRCPTDGVPEPDYAKQFLGAYQEVFGEMGVRDQTRETLEKAGGMTKDYFLSTISKINRTLWEALDEAPEAERYRIAAHGKRPQMRYAPNLEAEQVEIR